ncbi:fimbrial protein [Salmonella enterica]|nr:fimbrial protein [Salmonella enterica]
MKKKLTIAALVMGSLAAGAASANGGEVQFIGSVTDVTCDISPEVNGVLKNTVELGTMKTDGSGSQAVDFKLVPRDAACLAKTDASVGWASAGFDSIGLANMKGDATGASIKLITLNSSVPNTAITSNNQNVEFSKAGGIGALEFQAQLVKTGTAAATAGTVISSASYSVAYK